MERAGYPCGYSAALLASSTILGILIPPSVTMITYGWITGTSVLACFLSTVVPAIMLMVLLSLTNIIDYRKFSASTVDAPVPMEEIATAKQSHGRSFFSAIPALMMPVIILGGKYGGIFTPTEAASVAVVVTLAVGAFCYRTLHFSNFSKAFRDSSASIRH
jgi:TRAP-type C4-dicarboxylate transport system permease large subunit